MPRADSKILELFKRSTAQISDETVRLSIQDLELLIERHTKGAYDKNEYSMLFEKEYLNELRLSDEDASQIVYFLFYLLFNFPDERVAFSAKAISKCYNHNIEDGIINALLIFKDKNDFATVNLLKALLNTRRLNEVKKETQELLKEISKTGLEHSVDYLNSHFKMYKDQGGFDIWQNDGSVPN